MHRRLSCFRPFRSIDRKLELHSYFDHGPATERLFVHDFPGLRCEFDDGKCAERELGAVPRFDALRRTDVRASALVASREDSTGQRSGPAKYASPRFRGAGYAVRASTVSREKLRLPRAAFLERQRSRALLVHPVAG